MTSWWRLYTLLVLWQGLAHSRTLEQRFDQDSQNCQDSAKQVHGERDPNAELNHFLTCLMKKAKMEAEKVNDDPKEDLEIEDISNTLSKILNDPLFREDVDDFQRRIVRREAQNAASSAPQLDEQIVAALARNPEALKLVTDFLRKQEGRRRPAVPSYSQKQIKRVTRPDLGFKHRRQPPNKPQIQSRIDFFQPADPSPGKMDVNNPAVSGKLGNDKMEFFGPSDFKPDKPYALPFQQQFSGELPPVLPWQIGHIPIPR